MVAVGLVAGGIAALQALVPAEKDSPAVVRSTGLPHTTPPTAPPTTASPTPSPTATVVAKPAVTVLNNSRVTGLAKKAAADFAAGGWPIAGTGNVAGRVAHPTVYYDTGQQAAAEALRRQFPALVDLAPRYAALPGHGLTVVVTRDYPH